MEKFQNYYRIPSARAYWSDYTAPGCYFITICTANHENILGKITSGHLKLSEFGQIVLQEWNKSFEMRKELFCDVIVIMPNHIHAILRIDRNDEIKGMDGNISKSEQFNVETHSRASLQPNNNGVAYRPPKSVSSFVAGFKSAATKQINEFRNTPGITVWQTRFYDRIIRDKTEYEKIFWYIRHNVQNWKNDKYFC